MSISHVFEYVHIFSNGNRKIINFDYVHKYYKIKASDKLLSTNKMKDS